MIESFIFLYFSSVSFSLFFVGRVNIFRPSAFNMVHCCVGIHRSSSVEVMLCLDGSALCFSCDWISKTEKLTISRRKNNKLKMCTLKYSWKEVFCWKQNYQSDLDLYQKTNIVFRIRFFFSDKRR